MLTNMLLKGKIMFFEGFFSLVSILKLSKCKILKKKKQQKNQLQNRYLFLLSSVLWTKPVKNFSANYFFVENDT